MKEKEIKRNNKGKIQVQKSKINNGAKIQAEWVQEKQLFAYHGGAKESQLRGGGGMVFGPIYGPLTFFLYELRHTKNQG